MICLQDKPLSYEICQWHVMSFVIAVPKMTADTLIYLEASKIRNAFWLTLENDVVWNVDGRSNES